MTKVIIVDKDDIQIGLKERSGLTEKDTYRISGLWITNEKGQVLLARRKLTKKIEPGCWGPAVSGTVEEGETYDSNIVKEAEEELGLRDLKLVKLRKMPPFTFGGNYFVQIYSTVLSIDSGDLAVQKSEVEEVGWFNISELKQLIKDQPELFVASAPFWESSGSL